MSEKLTESEKNLDAKNRKKSMNSRKTLLPLYIYMILRNESNENHRLTGEDLIDRLTQSPYNLAVERKSLARTLKLLADTDLGIVAPDKRGGGYYYSKKTALATAFGEPYHIFDEDDRKEYYEDLYEGALELLRTKDIGDYYTIIQLQRHKGIGYNSAFKTCEKLKENGYLKSERNRYIIIKK